MKEQAATMDKTVSSRAMMIGLCGLVAGLLAVYGVYQWLDVEQLRSALTQFLERAQGTPYALPLICLIYLAGGAVLFPVMALNLAVAMVFGALWGTVYALTGALLSAAVFFALGRTVRKRGFRHILEHPRIQRVDQALSNSGVVGIALLRLIPMAPYSVFNLAAGISSIHFAPYMAGTLLALLPGSVARGIVGGSLTSIILDPTRENLIWLGAGLALWVLVMAGSHFLLKKYRKT